MNYRVVIRDRVANNIAVATFLAFEGSGDGFAITRAVDEILLSLSDDPAEQEELREGNERVIIVNPITAIYEVFEEQQVVLIYSAIYHPRRQL